MIARFVGQADIISGMMIKQGKVYNVEYLYQAPNEWLWFRISEIEQDKRDNDVMGAALFGIAWMFVAENRKMEIKIPYSSWSTFYANWQPMEEAPVKCGDNMNCPCFICPHCNLR